MSKGNNIIIIQQKYSDALTQIGDSGKHPELYEKFKQYCDYRRAWCHDIEPMIYQFTHDMYKAYDETPFLMSLTLDWLKAGTTDTEHVNFQGRSYSTYKRADKDCSPLVMYNDGDPTPYLHNMYYPKGTINVIQHCLLSGNNKHIMLLPVDIQVCSKFWKIDEAYVQGSKNKITLFRDKEGTWWLRNAESMPFVTASDDTSPADQKYEKILKGLTADKLQPYYQQPTTEDDDQ